MSSSFNKVIIMGNLTRDPEMRALNSGTAIAAFTVAVGERFKARDGGWQERTNFIDCEMFGPRAEAFAKYHGKGSQAFIEGRLRLDQWEDKEGNKRSKLKVVAENFEFVGGKGDGGGGGRSSRAGSAKPEVYDDIPF